MSNGSAVIAAAVEYLDRKNGVSKPVGKWDNASRFYPSDAEDCGVTASVRTPSRAFPYSYYKACFSVKHCAALYSCTEIEVKQAVKQLSNLR